MTTTNSMVPLFRYWWSISKDTKPINSGMCVNYPETLKEDKSVMTLN